MKVLYNLFVKVVVSEPRGFEFDRKKAIQFTKQAQGHGAF
jgi:hypothetical protein